MEPELKLDEIDSSPFSQKSEAFDQFLNIMSILPWVSEPVKGWRQV